MFKSDAHFALTHLSSVHLVSQLCGKNDHIQAQFIYFCNTFLWIY